MRKLISYAAQYGIKVLYLLCKVGCLLVISECENQ